MENPQVDPCKQWAAALSLMRPGEGVSAEFAAHVASCPHCATTVGALQTPTMAFRWLALGGERPKIPLQATLDALAREVRQWPLVLTSPVASAPSWREEASATAEHADERANGANGTIDAACGTTQQWTMVDDAAMISEVERVSADDACDGSSGAASGAAPDEQPRPAEVALATTLPAPPPVPPPALAVREPLSLSSKWTSASFKLPDDPLWYTEPHYSFEIAYALHQAYTVITDSDDKAPTERDATANGAKSAERSRLQNLLTQYIAKRMSAHQRISVYYALGRLNSIQEDYTQASRCVGIALELSQSLNDLDGCALLAYLHGTLVRYAQRFSEEARDYDLSFRFLNEGGNNVPHADIVLELEMLMRLAGSYFIRERYDISRRLLGEARQLVGLASQEQRHNPQALANIRQDAAGLEWLAALLFRWSGEPERALRHALSASEVYTELQRPQLLGRIAIVIADIALDLADNSADTMMEQTMTRAQHVYTALAEPYLRLALTTLPEVCDTPGESLARLTQVRFERMTRQITPRIATIEQVAQVARRRDDTLLLAQAQTALGDEFQLHGETESALSCYRLSLDTLRMSDGPALGVWARRRLLYAAEFMIP